jgi:hypothetical protein
MKIGAIRTITQRTGAAAQIRRISRALSHVGSHAM